MREGKIEDFAWELNDPTVYYLVDGIEPYDSLSRTLLVTSPRRETYHRFHNLEGTIIRYMPIWSKKEILACRVSLLMN